MKSKNLLQQTRLSSEEYQKAKKLKDFNPDEWKWSRKIHLYCKGTISK